MTEIRYGTSSDLNALLVLFDEVAEERVYIGTEPDYDREAYRQRFARMLREPEVSPLWVAVDGGKLVGMLAVHRHVEYGPTIGMMVAAEYRGRGTGRTLLAKAIAWGRQARLDLSLLVFPHNERALALYRSEGFVEIERYERDVVRQGGEVWDTMLMRRTFSK